MQQQELTRDQLSTVVAIILVLILFFFTDCFKQSEESKCYDKCLQRKERANEQRTGMGHLSDLDRDYCHMDCY